MGHLAIKSLTVEQKEVLEKYGKEFQSWIKSQKGQETSKTHRDHENFFKEKLTQEKIKTLTASEFGEIYKNLWASNIWGNKDWYVENKLLTPNSIEKIREELFKLLYGDSSIVERYNEFKNNIKGFGSSSLSEILHFVFPEKYCLWNDKPKTVLPYLGIDILPERFFKYQISIGEDYFECIQTLEVIKKELEKYGIKDFIDLDILFWHIFDDVLPRKKSSRRKRKQKTVRKTVIPKVATIKIDSHQAAQYYLLELGNMLGYLTYTPDVSKTFNDRKLGDVATLKEIPPFTGERDLKSASNIDVIWFSEDENPRACFEVEHSTGISPGLNRLWQLKQYRVKFFIIASEEDRGKFESEIMKNPYRTLREGFRFISYDELSRFFETVVPFHQLRVKLMGEEY